jgi:hypothetical protein
VDIGQRLKNLHVLEEKEEQQKVEEGDLNGTEESSCFGGLLNVAVALTIPFSAFRHCQ